MSGTAGQALLESLDTFKRKHVSQNREVIHKNAELMKVNADLTKRLRNTQEELMATKGALLRAKGNAFQLEIQIAGLQSALRKEQERHGSTASAVGDVEALRRTLDAIVLQAQHARDLVAADAHRSTTPISPPPVVRPTAAPVEPEAIAAAVAALGPRRERRATLVTPPELSHISEGAAVDEIASEPSPSSRLLDSPAFVATHAELAPSPIAVARSHVADRRARRRESGLQPPPPPIELGPAVEPRSSTPPASPSPPPPVDAIDVEPILPPIERPPVARTIRSQLALGMIQSPHWPAPSTAKTRARRSLSVPELPRVAAMQPRSVSPVEAAPRPWSRASRRPTITIRPDEPVAPRSSTTPTEPVRPSSTEVDETRPRPARVTRALADVTDAANRAPRRTGSTVPAPAVKRASVKPEPVGEVAPVAAEIEAPSDDSDVADVDVVGGREGRRARKTVSYAEPSLTAKLRRPEGYVPVTNTGKKRVSTVVAPTTTGRRSTAASVSDDGDAELVSSQPSSGRPRRRHSIDV